MSVAGGAGGVALTLMTGSTLNFYDKAYVSSHLSALFPNNKITFAVVDDFVGLDAALRTESQAVSAGTVVSRFSGLRFSGLFLLLGRQQNGQIY